MLYLKEQGVQGVPYTYLYLDHHPPRIIYTSNSPALDEITVEAFLRNAAEIKNFCFLIEKCSVCQW